MSYRKLKVNDEEYEYVIGKTYVKVKGIGVWPKEEVGEYIAKSCECCCEPVNLIYPDEKLSTSDYDLRVYPSHVASKIRNLVLT